MLAIHLTIIYYLNLCIFELWDIKLIYDCHKNSYGFYKL